MKKKTVFDCSVSIFVGLFTFLGIRLVLNEQPINYFSLLIMGVSILFLVCSLMLFRVRAFGSK